MRIFLILAIAIASSQCVPLKNKKLDTLELSEENLRTYMKIYEDLTKNFKQYYEKIKHMTEFLIEKYYLAQKRQFPYDKAVVEQIKEKLALVFNATELKKYPNECEILGDEDLYVVYNGSFLNAADELNNVLIEYAETILDPAYEELQTSYKNYITPYYQVFLNSTNVADRETSVFRVISYIKGVTQDIYDMEKDLEKAERDIQDFAGIYFLEKEYFEHRLADCEAFIDSQPVINKKNIKYD